MNLKRLAIPEQAQTDTRLKHYLAAVNPPMELKLRNWQVTDAGLVHLKGLSKLKDLNLVGTQITDAGLAYLAELTNLQKLNLIDCDNITDAGLVHLMSLTNLQELRFGFTQFTGAGQVHLKGLMMMSSPRQITAAAVAELQQALPRCKIYH
jgi:hypothetical protein